MTNAYTEIYLWEDKEDVRDFGLRSADVFCADNDSMTDLFNESAFGKKYACGAIIEHTESGEVWYDTFGDDDYKIYDLLISQYEE